MNEKYYFADDEYQDEIYGGSSAACLSIKTITELANGWEVSVQSVLDKMHEASHDEISEYGIYGE